MGLYGWDRCRCAEIEIKAYITPAMEAIDRDVWEIEEILGLL